MSDYHNPVLLEPSIDALVRNPDGSYADATFGGGSHSREILGRLSAKGCLMAFDRDEDALANAPDDPRFTLIHNNFRFIHNYSLLRAAREEAMQAAERGKEDDTRPIEEAMRAAGGRRRVTGEEGKEMQAEGEGRKQLEMEVQTREEEGADGQDGLLDGVLADLGVSSHQFDTAERGFSFRFSGPLDMRMNVQGSKTAADIVNSYTQEELERIFKLYGEVDNARKVAQLIAAARSASPIHTTDDLDNAIAAALPPFAEHKYLAKIYQALRIEVNEEMRSLEKFLQGVTSSLKTGGRLVVITYQSLEDRMVKNFIKTGNIAGEEQKDLYGRVIAPLRAVNRKPIVPDDAEIAGNTRARSAKLRIAEKI